jgi:hypothetical protein
MSTKTTSYSFPEDNVIDASLFKKNKKLQKDNLTDDIIKSLVLFHKKTDDSLKELSELCLKGKDGE